MAEYKFNKDGSLRTEDYKFTVYSLDDPALKQLREVVADHNKETRARCRRNKFNTGQYIANQLMRVRIMPRGPRVEAAWDDYKSRRAYDSYLPMRHGESFDVYVGRDTTAAYIMQRELQTGLTPGMQARIDRHQAEIWKIQQEGRNRLNG